VARGGARRTGPEAGEDKIVRQVPGHTPQHTRRMQSVALSSVTSRAAAARPTVGRSTRAARQQRIVTAASSSSNNNNTDESIMPSLGRRFQQAAMSIAAGAVIATSAPGAAMARLEGVNNPQMLPLGPVQEVLDVAGGANWPSACSRKHQSNIFLSGFFLSFRPTVPNVILQRFLRNRPITPMTY